MELSREIPCDITGMDAYLELDLVPDMNDEQFDQEFQKLIREHSDTKITTLLAKFVPQSVAGEIAAKSDVAGLYAQGFTKENRKSLIKNTKHLKIKLAGVPVMDRAYVTRGGVSLKEVDRKTMQSKKVPGLYIIGEALDIDGISGGYNLQACMSEAYLASKSILGI
jgi:predicted Rossmann fold flavoprotein